MCKNGSMNRTDGMARLRIMKMPCRHLLRAFRPAPFIHPFSRFSFLFSGKFLSSTTYTSTMGIRQLIKGIRLQRKLFSLFYASTSRSPAKMGRYLTWCFYMFVREPSKCRSWGLMLFDRDNWGSSWVGRILIENNREIFEYNYHQSEKDHIYRQTWIFKSLLILL